MTDTPRGRMLPIALWIAQVMLAIAYGMFGAMKAALPLPELAAKGMAWVAEPGFSPAFVRALGTLEMLGAIGLILPSLTRILPRLTVATALCFVVLQVIAICFHISRGETGTLGLNVVLIALAAFVFWGRSWKAVILARG